MKKLKNVFQVLRGLSLLTALIYPFFSMWGNVHFDLSLKILCSIWLFYFICKVTVEQIDNLE